MKSNSLKERMFSRVSYTLALSLALQLVAPVVPAFATESSQTKTAAPNTTIGSDRMYFVAFVRDNQVSRGDTADGATVATGTAGTVFSTSPNGMRFHTGDLTLATGPKDIRVYIDDNHIVVQPKTELSISEKDETVEIACAAGQAQIVDCNGKEATLTPGVQAVLEKATAAMADGANGDAEEVAEDDGPFKQVNLFGSGDEEEAAQEDASAQESSGPFKLFNDSSAQATPNNSTTGESGGASTTSANSGMQSDGIIENSEANTSGAAQPEAVSSADQQAPQISRCEILYKKASNADGPVRLLIGPQTQFGYVKPGVIELRQGTIFAEADSDCEIVAPGAQISLREDTIAFVRASDAALSVLNCGLNTSVSMTSNYHPITLPPAKSCVITPAQQTKEKALPPDGVARRNMHVEHDYHICAFKSDFSMLSLAANFPELKTAIKRPFTPQQKRLTSEFVQGMAAFETVTAGRGDYTYQPKAASTRTFALISPL